MDLGGEAIDAYGYNGFERDQAIVTLMKKN
jgi:hypothetical protein